MTSSRAFVLVLSGCCLLGGGKAALAAGSLTNSLTAFTGNSTQQATQSALATAGLAVTDVSSANAVGFDSSGALFGGFTSGDNGRNYLRTLATDYAAVSFEALITFVSNYGYEGQQGYFGLGSGEIGLYGVPDWGSQVSSVSAFLADTTQLMTFRTQNDINEFAPVPGAPTTGYHRVRMAFDSVARTMTFSVDLHHAGGAFVADLVAPAVDVSTLFGPTGWPTEPACIFFGGDDSVVLNQLVVNVAVPPDPPMLHVVKMPPTSLRLSWLNVGSFRLQQNSILGSTYWTSVTNVPFIAQGQAQVTLSANQSSQFFRLIYP